MRPRRTAMVGVDTCAKLQSTETKRRDADVVRIPSQDNRHADSENLCPRTPEIIIAW